MSRKASGSVTDRLFETDPFLHTEANRKLFLESFKEAASANYAGNEFFRKLWQRQGIAPQDVKTEEDLLRVPPILVTLFKQHELVSGPRDQIVLSLTSSGTGGQKSQNFLNQRSLDRVKKLAFKIHESLGMTSPAKTNYLCFTYDPRVAKDLGTAFTDELLTSFTGIQKVYYALQWDDAKKDFVFNAEGVVQTLREFEREGLPVRILGFPAFLAKILKEFDLHLDLGTDSWVQTGGGWKGFADEEIPKSQFRKLVSRQLGIPEANIRDLFGMVEHGIPYVDCELGNLHIPNYARVIIRSPDTLQPLEEGEKGLIQFLCSYIDSYPSISLLTTDWGRIGNCACPKGGATLEILGRAGISKHKGCAITALEKLR
jgi:phenylacetate-coenzyme A ligase PaaK-like adenylate-forming protein